MADWTDSLSQAASYMNSPMIEITKEQAELARRYMIKHQAEDLLEMLGL